MLKATSIFKKPYYPKRNQITLPEPEERVAGGDVNQGRRIGLELPIASNASQGI
jgi:hypothetical protein